MQHTKQIYLVGSRGSGKTSVGKILAQQLAWGFVDTDALLCEMQGKCIAKIVEAEGWDLFRDYESAALLAASKESKHVVATGGGIILREKNRDIMRTHGVVIFLEVPPEELVRRLSADPLEAQRPSLTGKSLLDEVKEVLSVRQKLYEDSAHIIVDGSKPIKAIIDNIMELLETKLVS